MLGNIQSGEACSADSGVCAATSAASSTAAKAAEASTSRRLPQQPKAGAAVAHSLAVRKAKLYHAVGRFNEWLRAGGKGGAGLVRGGLIAAVMDSQPTDGHSSSSKGIPDRCVACLMHGHPLSCVTHHCNPALSCEQRHWHASRGCCGTEWTARRRTCRCEHACCHGLGKRCCHAVIVWRLKLSSLLVFASTLRVALCLSINRYGAPSCEPAMKCNPWRHACRRTGLNQRSKLW